MSTFARLLACLILIGIGTSFIMHSETLTGMALVGIGCVVCGGVGLIEIALGET